MTTKQVQKLEHGFYIIFWKKSEGGGYSYASVGSTANGDRWMAPTNWIDLGTLGKKSLWRRVKKVIKV